MKRDFKGVWIPKEVWLCKELTLQEKVFLVEIDSLDNADHCYASNAHFADFFGLSKGRCSQIISSLEEKGFIHIDYEREDGQVKRRVVKILKGVFRKLIGGIKNPKGGYLENDKGINTNNNNTSINTTKRESAREDSSDSEPPVNLFGDVPASHRPKEIPPERDWVCRYFGQAGLTPSRAKLETDKFFDHYESCGWKVGRNKMKDWNAACRQWIRRLDDFNTNQNKQTDGSELQQRGTVTENVERSMQKLFGNRGA